MDSWLSFAGLFLCAGAALWLLLRRQQEDRRIAELLEKCSGRAVLRFSRTGALRSIGPNARKVLGFEYRVDPIGSEDLPLEGLDAWLFDAGSPELAGSRSLAPIVLHTGGLASPLRAELVPERPLRGPLPAILVFDAPAPAAVEAPVAEPPVVEAKPAPARTRLLEGVRVLLAEDGPDNQLLLSYKLQGQGAELVLVETGADAVEQVRSQSFDLVLLDMQMPVMDGFEATERIREFAPNLPIVALTAYTGDAERERCYAVGCTHFLAKPVRRKDLVELADKLASLPRVEEPCSALSDDELFADPEFQALIASFVGELDGRVDEIRLALEAGDWITVERLAHRLKGAAGGFGMCEIAAASSELESIAPEQNRERVGTAVESLSALVQGVSPATKVSQSKPPGV